MPALEDELGVLAWGDEVDIAPETLYAKATGEPLPAWMHTDQAAEERRVAEATEQYDAAGKTLDEYKRGRKTEA